MINNSAKKNKLAVSDILLTIALIGTFGGMVVWKFLRTSLGIHNGIYIGATLGATLKNVGFIAIFPTGYYLSKKDQSNTLSKKGFYLRWFLVVICSIFILFF